MWPAILTRPTGSTLAERPSHTLFFWLVGAFLLTLLPHVAQLPGWLTVTILLSVTLRSIAEWKRWPLPSTVSTGVVAVCLLAGIYLQFHTIVGREAGTAFMAGLLMIKFYELRGSRDITVIIFTSFFVVMSALLFSQAIELFIYCLIMMWLLTGILLRTYMGDRPENRLLRVLPLSSLIFFQALPFALFLFFFFPRYSGRLQLSFSDTMTGLTDHVEPGSIARLSENDAPALRVYFHTLSLPTPDMMYWRAIVLWNFDGSAWTRGSIADRSQHQPALVPESAPIVQDIIIWPQNQRWIPALDLPVTPATDKGSTDGWSTSLIGDVLVPANIRETIDYKRQYTVTSSALIDDQTLIPDEAKAATQLPVHTDARVRALADRLYAPFAASQDTAGYIRAVLHYFREQHFELTNEPGELGHDPVAEFLFETKKGFCEHYASAFGVLMRVEGIPTRLIAGYRGGEYNPYGSFFLVSQSNAHVWNEVWLQARKHWMRVDPTTAISAGSRRALAINEGIDTDDDDLSVGVADHRFTLLSAASLPLWMQHSLRDLQMRRDEMEAQWDDWVFSYDPGTQDRLAQALGLGRQAWLVLLVGCLTVAALASLVITFFLSRKKPLPPVEHFYARFCRAMAQRGQPRQPWEGPLAYTQRLAETFPEKGDSLRDAGWIVTRTRYGAAPAQPPLVKELDSLLGLIVSSDSASSSRERR
jgi:transglutaminase-like putative cysteine protease